MHIDTEILGTETKYADVKFTAINRPSCVSASFMVIVN